MGKWFLDSYKENYISSLISSDKIKAGPSHLTKRFINDLYVINHVGEFGRYISQIYPKGIEIKVEHQGDYATLSNLYITIKEGTFFL